MVTKKIKDLTVEETEKICDNHYSCDNCPLNTYSYIPCMKNIIQSCKENLEKEVEVEE